jgi:hypothetical protein
VMHQKHTDAVCDRVGALGIAVGAAHHILGAR